MMHKLATVSIFSGFWYRSTTLRPFYDLIPMCAEAIGAIGNFPQSYVGNFSDFSNDGAKQQKIAPTRATRENTKIGKRYIGNSRRPAKVASASRDENLFHLRLHRQLLRARAHIKRSSL